jgi:hypothetical protein
MLDQGGFPRRLLKESAEARKAYFKSHPIGHTKINEVAHELLRLIREPADAEVIHLIGPTGVGKTTVMGYVIKKLFELALPELEQNPGQIPAAFMVARNPERGVYDWKEHYVSTMIALNEVLIDKKIYLPEPGPHRDAQKARVLERAGGVAALRRAAESALENRIKFGFFVDEAQYMTKNKSGPGLENQADTIRSIAFESKTLHVLVGTYALRFLRNLNGQLGRRSHTVHFERYRIEDGKDEENRKNAQSFSEAFVSLQDLLPLEKTPDLTKHVEFCFSRCVGCVGHLKSWFTRGLDMALEDNLDTIPSRLFLKAAPPKSVWEQIVAEVKEGEDALAEADDELASEWLKVAEADTTGSAKSVRGKKSPGTEKKNTSAKSNRTSSKRSRKGRRIEPKPKRYPVGINKNVN